MFSDLLYLVSGIIIGGILALPVYTHQQRKADEQATFYQRWLAPSAAGQETWTGYFRGKWSENINYWRGGVAATSLIANVARSEQVQQVAETAGELKAYLTGEPTDPSILPKVLPVRELPTEANPYPNSPPPPPGILEPVSNAKYSAAAGRDLHEYLVSHSVRKTPEIKGLLETTLRMGRPAAMCSPPDSIAILQQLVRLTRATRVLEVGVFTGFTTLAFALALPDFGQVVACDVNDEWASKGKPYWRTAGVTHKIDLRIAPAADTMDELISGGGEGSFDLAFIDADKANYDTYYEKALQLVRKGGLVVIDNVLWFGKVIDDKVQDADTKAIRALNDKVFADERVDVCMLSNSDGITLALKR